MDQRAYLAIVAMLNGFPQTAGNPDLTLGTYEKVLDDVSPEAIIEAARRYTQGEVKDQSLSFAPSIAEFVQEARQREEYIALRAKPRIPAPVYRRSTDTPFERLKERKAAENAHLPVLFTDQSTDDWNRKSAARLVPPGSKWVLGIIYGPEPGRPAAE